MKISGPTWILLAVFTVLFISDKLRLAVNWRITALSEKWPASQKRARPVSEISDFSTIRLCNPPPNANDRPAAFGMAYCYRLATHNASAKHDRDRSIRLSPNR